MSKEDAYSLLEAIAEINGLEKKLKLWKQTDKEKAQEETAEEIQEESKERLSPFSFSKCNIAIGEEIEFWPTARESSGITVTVVDDKHVEYNGETWSLTALAKHLLGVKWSMAGPKYFKYNNEWLNDIRSRLSV